MGRGSVHHRREHVAGGVYIGRPSVFGNPFVIGRDGDRAAVAGLAGRKLVCWCAPAPCHGDVLLELAEALR